MTAKSVQVSIDEELLAEVDRHPETRRAGRSAFIRRALRAYLELRRRRDDDAAYERAYGGESPLDEFEEILDSQPWPET